MTMIISISFAISLLTYHILQKFGLYDRLTPWLIFQRLYFYLPPTTELLRSASGISKPKAKEGNRRHRRGQDVQENDAFLVSKDVDIDLHRTHLGMDIISGLKYYMELKWLLSVFVTAAIAYAVTEGYYFTRDLITGAAPNTARQVETNFSLLWCIVTALLAIFILGRLIHLYYGATERGEFFLVLLVGTLGAILSMVILAFNQSTLEFGLKDAHRNFTEKLQQIPSIAEISRAGKFSYFGFGLFIGLLSGLSSALVAFPGIRFGKMYREAREDAAINGRHVDVLLYSTSFGLPIALCVLWMTAVRDNLWYPNTYISIETFRILSVLLLVAVRLATLQGFLQAHLDSPRKRLKALNKEPGRIEADKLQFLLAAPSRYIGVAAVQYMAPLVILTMLCFLYMSADLESFFPVRSNWVYNKFFVWLGLPQDYTSTVFEIHNAIWSLLTGALLKALFGYFIWWIVLSHFSFALYAFYLLQDQQ